jgi:hypothetical protein
MRRCVHAGLDSCGKADRIQKGTHRTLAVGTGYLNLQIILLGISERRQQLANALEPSFIADTSLPSERRYTDACSKSIQIFLLTVKNGVILLVACIILFYETY